MSLEVIFWIVLEIRFEVFYWLFKNIFLVVLRNLFKKVDFGCLSMKLVNGLVMYYRFIVKLLLVVFRLIGVRVKVMVL